MAPTEEEILAALKAYRARVLSNNKLIEWKMAIQMYGLCPPAHRGNRDVKGCEARRRLIRRLLGVPEDEKIIIREDWETGMRVA